MRPATAAVRCCDALLARASATPVYAAARLASTWPPLMLRARADQEEMEGVRRVAHDHVSFAFVAFLFRSIAAIVLSSIFLASSFCRPRAQVGQYCIR